MKLELRNAPKATVQLLRTQSGGKQASGPASPPIHGAAEVMLSSSASMRPSS